MRVLSRHDYLRVAIQRSFQGRAKQRGRIRVEIDRGIGMPAHNGSWRHRADLSLEACLYCLSFALVWYNSKNFFRLENLFGGHRDRLLGNLRDVGKPGLAYLLLAAGLVQIHDDVRFLDVKVGRRIIKRDVSILTDT